LFLFRVFLIFVTPGAIFGGIKISDEDCGNGGSRNDTEFVAGEVDKSEARIEAGGAADDEVRELAID
jgi:hypothetical protein